MCEAGQHMGAVLLMRLLPSRVFCWTILLLVIGAAQETSSDEEFQVLKMLPSTFPDAGTEFTSECFAVEAQTGFRESFGAAAEMMLKKTKRSMHDGLLQVADSVLKLVEACSCCNATNAEKMKSQALRLQVFATSRGMLNIGSQVSYEPMKGLTVGGIDVHKELNELLVAWKLNKGEEEVGRTLKQFMEEFQDEEALPDWLPDRDECYIEYCNYYEALKRSLCCPPDVQREQASDGAWLCVEVRTCSATDSQQVESCKDHAIKHGLSEGRVTQTIFSSSCGGTLEDGKPNLAARLAEAAAETPTVEKVAPVEDPHRRSSRHFWRDAMNSAFAVLGDATKPVAEGCFSDGDAADLAQGIEESFENMLLHTRRKMQEGLKGIGNAIQSSLGKMLGLCSSLESSMGSKRLRSAASRLLVFAPSRTLMNFGSHIDYEALKVLKVGGIDVHKEINELIGAWRKNDNPEIVGEKLAKFFEDFSEEASEEVAPKPEQEIESELSLMSVVLRDAFEAAGDGTGGLDQSCFAHEAKTGFETDVTAAIDHILKKRKRTMQQGLKEFGDATDKLIKSLPTQCSSSDSAKVISKAGRKLQRLTRRTVVDYGTHIKYEAMKSLSVGGVDIHKEINAFIGAWSLGNRRESGGPLGKLLLKLSQIVGHDEF